MYYAIDKAIPCCCEAHEYELNNALKVGVKFMCVFKLVFGNKEKISSKAIKHSTIGNFNTQGRMVSGGHSQKNIIYLEKNNIPYNVEKYYIMLKNTM